MGCRFIFNLKQLVKKLKLNEGILTTEELEKSEKAIIWVVQSEVFAAELKYLTEKSGTTKPTNYIREFNLFLDEDHLLTLSHLGDLIHSQPGGGGGRIPPPSVTLLSLIQIEPNLVWW